MQAWFKKSASILVLSLFTVNTCFADIAGMGIEFSAKPETPQLIQIDIPAQLASVEEFWEAPARPNPKMILQIQNAHTNYEAQSKIRDLMSYLNQNYGFKTIFVEGASEELNPEYLKLFPDAETNKKLWDELAKRGQITGADWFLLNDEKSGAKGVGIENAELYKKNYEALKAVYSRESETAKFIGGLESELDKLATKTLPPETRKIISEWKKFEKGHREFIPFVESLSKLAKQVINLDLKALYSQIEWPQVTRILVLQEMEKKLQTRAAESERQVMLDWMKTNNVSKELIVGLERFNEKDINMNRIRASSGKMESLPRFFVEKLVEEAGPKGLKFSDYPNFALYTGYLILRYEIEPTALFEEIRKLFEQLLDVNGKAYNAQRNQLSSEVDGGDAQSANDNVQIESQSDLIELFRDAELVRKLLNLELSRGEWGTVLARKAEIEPARIFERVKAVAEGAKSPEQGAKILTEYQKQIHMAFENAFSFYDLAIQRDDVFYEKMAKALETSDRAILMTGGFHTEGLREIFREKEISYGTITPRLTQVEKSNLYREVMLGKSNFTGQRPKVDDQTVEIWSLLNQTGLTPDSARFSVERISAAIYEATNGKSFDGKAIADHLNSGLFGKENFKVDYNGRNFEVVARSEARIPNLATEAEFDAKAINPELFQKGNEAASAGNYDQAIVSYYQFLGKLKALLTSGISLIALDDAEKAARKNLKLAILGKMNLLPAGDEKVLYVFHGHKTIQPVIANGIIAHKEKLGYRGGDGYYTTTYPHSALGYAGYTFDPASLVAFPNVYQSPVDPAVVIVAIRGYDEATIPKIDFDALSREASRRSIVEDRDGKEILEELITEQIGDAPAYKLIYKMSDGGEGDILDGGGDEIVIRDPSILNSNNMIVVSPEKILSPEAMIVLGVPSPKNPNVPSELQVDTATFPKLTRSEARSGTVSAKDIGSILADKKVMNLIPDSVVISVGTGAGEKIESGSGRIDWERAFSNISSVKEVHLYEPAAKKIKDVDSAASESSKAIFHGSMFDRSAPRADVLIAMSVFSDPQLEKVTEGKDNLALIIADKIKRGGYLVLGYYKDSGNTAQFEAEKKRHARYLKRLERAGVSLSPVIRGTDARHHWTIYKVSNNRAQRSESRLEKFVQTAKIAAVGSVGVVSGIAAGAVFFALMPAFSSLLFPIALAGVVFLSLSKALKYKQFLQTDGAAESKSVRAWIGKEMKSDFDRILRQLNLLVFSEDLRVESGFVDIALANIRNGIHFLIDLVFSGPAMLDLESQIRTVTRTSPRADSAPMGQRSESRDISRREFLSKGLKALAGVAILNPVSAGAQSVTDLDRRSRQVELTKRLIKYFEGYTSEDLKKAAVERERKNPLNFSDVSVKLTEILNAVVPGFGDTDVDRAQRDQAIHDIKNMLLIILSIESGNLEYLIQRKWTKPTKENLIPEHQPIYVAVGPFQIEIGPHSSFTGQDLLLSFLQYGKGQGFSGEARGLLHDYLARKMGLLAANQEGGNEIKKLLEQLDFPRGLPEKATPEEKAAHDAALKASRDKLGLILGRMMIENVDDTGLYFGVLNVLRKLQAPNKESFLAKVNEMKADPALFYGVKYRGAAQLADANKKKVEKAMVHLKENRLWTEAPLKEKSATPAAVVQKPLVTPQPIAIDENNLPPYFIDETNPIYSQSDLVAFEPNPLKWYLPGLGLLGVYAIFAAVAWNKLTPRLARAMIWISGLIQGLFFAGLLAFIGDYFYSYIFDRSLVESVSLFESIDSVIYLNAISISLFLFNYFGLRKIASQGRQVARSAPERETGPRRSEMRAVNGEITAIAYSKRAKNEFEAALKKGELIPQRANTSGANEAVIYEGSRGKWYAKQYNNPDQARAELLSWLIYRQLDIPVAQEMFVTEINGDVLLVSKMMPGDAVWDGYEDSSLAAREFVASAFTQDRDRSKPDNYRKYQGQIYALDFGSSAMFRSNGEIKGEGEDQGALSFSAENFLDMLSIESQHHSKSFFRSLSQDQIDKQIAFVAERLTEDDLNQMINAAFIDESSVKEKISKVYEAAANELDELAQRFEFAEDTTVSLIRLEAVKQPVLQIMIVVLRNAWINFIRLFTHRKANHGDLQRFSAGTKSERVVPVLEALLTKQDASELISQRILEVNRFGSPQLTINPQQLAKWNDMPWYHGFDEAKLDSETGRPILEEIIFGENPGLRPSLVNGVNRPTVARDVRTAKNYVGKEGRDVILAFDAVKARSFLTDPFASIMNASAVVEDSYIPPSALTNDSKKYVITRFPDKTSDELAAALGATKEWVTQAREDIWSGKTVFDEFGLTPALNASGARSEMRTLEDLADNLIEIVRTKKTFAEFMKSIGELAADVPELQNSMLPDTLPTLLKILKERQEIVTGRYLLGVIGQTLVSAPQNMASDPAPFEQKMTRLRRFMAIHQAVASEDVEYFGQIEGWEGARFYIDKALFEAVLKEEGKAPYSDSQLAVQFERQLSEQQNNNTALLSFDEKLAVARTVVLKTKKTINLQRAELTIRLQLGEAVFLDLSREPDGAVKINYGKEQFLLLPGELASIGRSSSNKIKLTEPNVSREHATIALGKDGALIIRDLVSRNGTSFIAVRSEMRSEARVYLDRNGYLQTKPVSYGFFNALAAAESVSEANQLVKKEILDFAAELRQLIRENGFIPNKIGNGERSVFNTKEMREKEEIGLDDTDLLVMLQSDKKELDALAVSYGKEQGRSFNSDEINQMIVDRMADILTEAIWTYVKRHEAWVEWGRRLQALDSFLDKQEEAELSAAIAVFDVGQFLSLSGEYVFGGSRIGRGILRGQVDVLADFARQGSVQPQHLRLNFFSIALASLGYFQKGPPSENSPDQAYPVSPSKFWNEHVQDSRTNLFKHPDTQKFVREVSEDEVKAKRVIEQTSLLIEERQLKKSIRDRTLGWIAAGVAAIVAIFVVLVSVKRFSIPPSEPPATSEPVKGPESKSSRSEMRSFESFDLLLKHVMETAGSSRLQYLDLDTGTGSFIPAFINRLQSAGGAVQAEGYLGAETIHGYVADALKPRILGGTAQIEEDYKDLPKESFDLITVNNIESSPHTLIQRAAELLKPGGFLLVSIERFDHEEGGMTDRIRGMIDSQAGLELYSQAELLDGEFNYPQYASVGWAPAYLLIARKHRSESRAEEQTEVFRPESPAVSLAQQSTEELVALLGGEKNLERTLQFLTKKSETPELALLRSIKIERANDSQHEVYKIELTHQGSSYSFYVKRYKAEVLNDRDEKKGISIRSPVEVALHEEKIAKILSPLGLAPEVLVVDAEQGLMIQKKGGEYLGLDVLTSPIYFQKLAFALGQMHGLGVSHGDLGKSGILHRGNILGVSSGWDTQAAFIDFEFGVLQGEDQVLFDKEKAGDVAGVLAYFKNKFSETDRQRAEDELKEAFFTHFYEKGRAAAQSRVVADEIATNLVEKKAFDINGQPLMVSIFSDGNIVVNEAKFNPKQKDLIRIGRGSKGDVDVHYSSNEVSRVQAVLSFNGRNWVLFNYSPKVNIVDATESSKRTEIGQWQRVEFKSSRTESREEPSKLSDRAASYALKILDTWYYETKDVGSEGGQKIEIESINEAGGKSIKAYQVIYSPNFSPWGLLLYPGEQKDFDKGGEVGRVSIVSTTEKVIAELGFSDDRPVLTLGRSLDYLHQGQGLMSALLEQVLKQMQKFATEDGEPMPYVITDIINLPTVMNAAYTVPFEWVGSKYPHFSQSRESWAKQVVNWQAGNDGVRENGIFAENGKVIQQREYAAGTDSRHIIESHPSVTKQISDIQQDARDIVVSYLLDPSVSEVDKEIIYSELQNSAIARAYVGAGFGKIKISPIKTNEGLKLYFVFDTAARSEVRLGFGNTQIENRVQGWIATHRSRLARSMRVTPEEAAESVENLIQSFIDEYKSMNVNDFVESLLDVFSDPEHDLNKKLSQSEYLMLAKHMVLYFDNVGDFDLTSKMIDLMAKAYSMKIIFGDAWIVEEGPRRAMLPQDARMFLENTAAVFDQNNLELRKMVRQKIGRSGNADRVGSYVDEKLNDLNRSMVREENSARASWLPFSEAQAQYAASLLVEGALYEELVWRARSEMRQWLSEAKLFGHKLDSASARQGLDRDSYFKSILGDSQSRAEPVKFMDWGTSNGMALLQTKWALDGMNYKDVNAVGVDIDLSNVNPEARSAGGDKVEWVEAAIENLDGPRLGTNSYDFILFNAPYIAVDIEHTRAKFKKWLDQAKLFLKPNGVLIIRLAQPEIDTPEGRNLVVNESQVVQSILEEQRRQGALSYVEYSESNSPSLPRGEYGLGPVIQVSFNRSESRSGATGQFELPLRAKVKFLSRNDRVLIEGFKKAGLPDSQIRDLGNTFFMFGMDFDGEQLRDKRKIVFFMTTGEMANAKKKGALDYEGMDPQSVRINANDMESFMFAYSREFSGAQMISGVFIPESVLSNAPWEDRRGQGYLPQMLEAFFKQYPGVTQAHPYVRNLVLLYILQDRFNFVPQETGETPFFFIKRGGGEIWIPEQFRSELYNGDDTVRESGVSQTLKFASEDELVRVSQDENYVKVPFGVTLVRKARSEARSGFDNRAEPLRLERVARQLGWGERTSRSHASAWEMGVGLIGNHETTDQLKDLEEDSADVSGEQRNQFSDLINLKIQSYFGSNAFRVEPDQIIFVKSSAISKYASGGVAAAYFDKGIMVVNENMLGEYDLDRVLVHETLHLLFPGFAQTNLNEAVTEFLTGEIMKAPIRERNREYYNYVKALENVMSLLGRDNPEELKRRISEAYRSGDLRIILNYLNQARPNSAEGDFLMLMNAELFSDWGEWIAGFYPSEKSKGALNYFKLLKKMADRFNAQAELNIQSGKDFMAGQEQLHEDYYLFRQILLKQLTDPQIIFAVKRNVVPFENQILEEKALQLADRYNFEFARSESRTITESAQRVEGNFATGNFSAVDRALESKAYQAAVAILSGGIVFAAGEATMQNLQSVESFLSSESSEKWLVDLLELPGWSGNETGVTIELTTQKRLLDIDVKNVEAVLMKNPASRYALILMDGSKVEESWTALAKQYPKQFMIELKDSTKIKNGLSKMMDGIGLKPVQVTGLQEALLGYQSSLKGLLGVRDTRSIVINPEDDQASYHLVRIAKTIVAGQASGIDQLPQDEIRIFEPDSKDGNVWNIRKGALAQLAKIVLEIQAQAKAAISA